ncbi:MAG: hypothetical protein H7210_11415 [Pyrinomonadaceae bacterium]|nr:hypothetical protein [Phycisphaerales bacterium]
MSVDHSSKLSLLLERLARAYPDIQPTPTPQWGQPMIDEGEPMLSEFVRSMLLWESTTAKAEAALKRIQTGVVDFNELRVCLPGELVGLMGETYPLARERAERLRAALNEIFTRGHAVTLKHLAELGKREVLHYLESLSGVPQFVAARVALLFLGNHAMPVDSRILRVLLEAQAVAPGETQDSAASMLEHRIRAGELMIAYLHLQARADELGAAEQGPSGNGVKAAAASEERPKRTIRGGRSANVKPGATPPKRAADA